MTNIIYLNDFKLKLFIIYLEFNNCINKTSFSIFKQKYLNSKYNLIINHNKIFENN